MRTLLQSIYVLNVAVCVCATTIAFAGDPTAEQIAFFETEIRPLLVSNCFECHGSDEQESELRLDSLAAGLKGGKRGAAIVPGDPQASLLVQSVRYDAKLKMPPDGKLQDRQIAMLEKWIFQGAAWPKQKPDAGTPRIRGGAFTEEERAFWSFQPIRDPPPPRVKNEAWPLNEIDRFVLARLEAAEMRPAIPADRHTWLRRVTFDLTGLPPAPAELQAFLADESPESTAKVIDRLLDSRAYGERWGRHWLDVVRYADTAGETADYPVPEAYLFRNWVIDAFHRDLPYDQFLREQIAGDLLGADLLAGKNQPDEAVLKQYEQLVIATGFIAISRRFGFDPQNYHHLTIQDTIDTLGQAVMGLSLGCARCHDHKYDPVNQEDYYALYGILESTKYAFPGSEEKKRPADFVTSLPPEIVNVRQGAREAAVNSVKMRIAGIEQQKNAVQAALAKRGNHVSFYVRVLENLLDQGVANVDGRQGFHIYRRTGSDLPLVGVNTLDIEQKVPGTAPPRGFVAHPNVQGAAGIAWRSPIAGKVRISGRIADAHHAGDSVAWHIDHVNEQGFAALAQGDVKVAAAQMLEEGGDAANLQSVPVESGDLIQLAILPKTNIGADLTSIELLIEEIAGQGRSWNLAQDVVPDFLEGGQGNPHSDLHGNADVWYFYKVPNADRGRSWAKAAGDNPDAVAAQTLAEKSLEELLALSDKLAGEASVLQAEIASLEKHELYSMIYGVVEGAAKNAQIHIRGEPQQLGEEVPRRFLEILGKQPLPAEESGSGRRELAEWLTARGNPLTARVMVNRIWQHHFGEGLVRTENDFGARGQRPTHPELLDWLATRFMESGWSIKALHRLILQSQTYRMSSRVSPEYADRDPANRLLWHHARQRLAAEEIRDAILAISGDLDPTMGGPHPFPPVAQWGFTQHNPFYAVYETNRRSVYLMQQRLKRHPFLGLFDGADPNVPTARRMLTTTPTQALFLMNSPFVHQQSRSFAQRLVAEIGDGEQQIRLAYRATVAREPDQEELQRGTEFLRVYAEKLPAADGPAELRSQAAMAAFVRTLFVRNEFLFVD